MRRGDVVSPSPLRQRSPRKKEKKKGRRLFWKRQECKNKERRERESSQLCYYIFLCILDRIFGKFIDFLFWGRILVLWKSLFYRRN